MTAVSLSMSRGASGTQISDITVGSSAPATGEIELRYQLLDTHSKSVTRKDIALALLAFKRFLDAGGNPNILVTNAPPL